MGITKTDFMRGMQCPRMLWLDKHRPELRVIPPEVQSRLDAGNDFGDRAMGMFGPYEEMTVYRPGTHIPDKKAMLARTAEHLALGTPVLCEAAFSFYNNYCAVDILRRTETGHDFYEVKNSPEVKDQFVRDAAFQFYIITRSGLKIDRVFLVLHGPEEEHPFLPAEITLQVRALYPWIDEHLWPLARIPRQREEVAAKPGPQCTDPYECWYYAYCHGLPRPNEQLAMDLG